MNWHDYTTEVVSAQPGGRVYHLAHRRETFPGRSSQLACGRYGEWRKVTATESLDMSLCSVCLKAIDRAKRRAP